MLYRDPFFFLGRIPGALTHGLIRFVVACNVNNALVVPTYSNDFLCAVQFAFVTIIFLENAFILKWACSSAVSSKSSNISVNVSDRFTDIEMHFMVTRIVTNFDHINNNPSNERQRIY